LPVKYFFHAG